ncbi:hypothetical protein A6770_35405 [Nostoc minutum NIES-26]|uniref:Inactive STAND domain-containing protein n=1 Tax=Nostoc minutum NIES-26 TaxID=1844469 RepID=A0A367S212_9NOSO|nr:hypothetical protein A6770_35405 [Nostoc minutum NIES-26]
MPDSQDPKQVNNDLRNAQFGGGLINAESVNAGRIGGDIYNIHIGQQIVASSDSAQSQNQQQRSLFEKDSLEKAYTLQSQKVASIRNAWVIETDPSRKFQYEQQLQTEECTLKELANKLDAVERQLQADEDSELEVDTGIYTTNSRNTVQNISFQQSGLSSAQALTSQFKKELPPLLPYLANRREQEAQLCEVFLKFLKQASASHLVCIIHGDEAQCHYNFLERMRKFSLPKLLDVDPQQPIIPTYHLEWPAKLKNLHELSNQLYKNLADSVLGHSLYSSEKINVFLSNYPYPVIIHTHLLTEDLQRQGLNSLDKLLEFCYYLHQSITTQRLIIYICIKYKSKRKKNKNTAWIKWLFSFGRYFFKQYQYQKINKKIRQYLQNLSNSNLSHSQPIPVVVLPELEGINKAEAENWVRSEHTKQLVGEDMIEPLIQKVGEIFEFWEEQTSSDTIPMSCLAEELSKLIKSLMSKQGESV